ncbi:hypothetical protein CRG98_023461 [Punica granatum]|uniref:Retrotransposon gag domain-containing protein n=1 Tax=Punica granatum TaxID=22663 RepID=A0A2I0JJK9_PUNGR|nr:hypothetical protein CRG98_023461 [Punica granatum]
MRLPPKFKVPEFKTYEGTMDPRHHLRHYRGKMLQYWEYKEFVIHSFQDSLSGSALDWFMSLKAEDIPTWEDLSRKGVYYSHLLAHTSSFSDLIEAGCAHPNLISSGHACARLRKRSLRVSTFPGTHDERT